MFEVFVLISLFACVNVGRCEYRFVYLNEYIIQTNDSDISIVKHYLLAFNLTEKRKILPNFYNFVRENDPHESTTPDTVFTRKLENCCEGKVIFAKQIVESFKSLWTKPPLPVDNTGGDDDTTTPLPDTPAYAAIRVPEVWDSGITGNGVVIAVTDVGINVHLPDLAPNIAKEHSYNMLSNNTNIMPDNDASYPEMELLSDHGSNCAGLIAAMRNSECGDGVAYGAKVAGLKIFEIKQSWGKFKIGFTDERAAAGLSYANQAIDIYSNSWSTTKNFDPHHFGLLSQQALEHGVTQGRHGKGSIYVFPVGGVADGYNNSPYTISVNEVVTDGQLRKNALACACTLTSTYGAKSIPTAILKTVSSFRHTNCTNDFIGTSAATAIIAGSIALALEANENLTWRDVQHLVVEASERRNVQDQIGFKRNGAGMFYHNKLGFGILNVKKMVELAKNWTTFHKQQCEIKTMLISKGCSPCESNVDVNKLDSVEHVTFDLSYKTPNENNTQITVQSPSGTVSVLLHIGQSGFGAKERQNVTLSTVHFWGELATGTWKLFLEQDTDRGYRTPPELSNVHITLCGTGLVREYDQPEIEDAAASYPPGTTSTPGPSSTTSRSDSNNDLLIRIVVGIVGGIMVFVLIWMLSCCFCHTRLKTCLPKCFPERWRRCLSGGWWPCNTKPPTRDREGETTNMNVLNENDTDGNPQPGTSSIEETNAPEGELKDNEDNAGTPAGGEALDQVPLIKQAEKSDTDKLATSDDNEPTEQSL